MKYRLSTVSLKKCDRQRVAGINTYNSESNGEKEY